MPVTSRTKATIAVLNPFNGLLGSVVTEATGQSEHLPRKAISRVLRVRSAFALVRNGEAGTVSAGHRKRT
jgi:hypothetical protein